MNKRIISTTKRTDILLQLTMLDQFLIFLCLLQFFLLVQEVFLYKYIYIPKQILECSIGITNYFYDLLQMKFL